METIHRIRDKFIPEPLPAPGTFQGRTVVVTGGTSGLGLAAAVHFVSLGAHVIITCRDPSRGESARLEIEKRTRADAVEMMVLDMTRYSSCCSFVDELSKRRPQGVDAVVLNAGVSKTHHDVSPEGWEETIQVNALCTTLLGLLLLPWLKKQTASSTPHMVFVASRDHLDPDITSWAPWGDDGAGILRRLSDRAHVSWPSGAESSTDSPNYAASKLLLMYAVEEITKLALDSEGQPKVIVNSVCPGLVHTNIARDISSHSWQMKLAVNLFFATLGKSADYGSRFYVAATQTTADEHGKFIVSLYSDDEYRKKAIPNMTSDAGKATRVLVWKEIIAELVANVPGLQATLNEI
ncbi:hypothetical protein F66182_2353 [Fusarium sp. NRRL 66182]|nr:hypothetical protein F66182_2353 [Fusarium sp. NRRL 66182]